MQENEENPVIMAAPGTYLREDGIVFLVNEFRKESVMPVVRSILE